MRPSDATSPIAFADPGQRQGDELHSDLRGRGGLEFTGRPWTADTPGARPGRVALRVIRRSPAHTREPITDSRHPLSVLVVDDCHDTARSTAELLALWGFNARSELCGDEAVRLAEADPPDVVLMDVRMPGQGGCEVARRLAARTTGKPPVLVALTGCRTDADRARTARAGFHLHLVKPVDPAVLVGILRRIQTALAPPLPFDPYATDASGLVDAETPRRSPPDEHPPKADDCLTP